jgi:hypothetical protein
MGFLLSNIQKNVRFFIYFYYFHKNCVFYVNLLFKNLFLLKFIPNFREIFIKNM